jgi:hypothetical protein
METGWWWCQMIDTMQLLLTEYDCKDAKLKLQPSPIDMATGAATANFPLWHNGTQMVEGAYAYHRQEHVNVKLYPMPKPEGQGMGTICSIRFEVPKFAGDDNYHPTDIKGTRKALRSAEKHLATIGIKTSLKTAQVSRLDAFKNVVADEPFACYQSVLGLLSGSRMKQRGYENGFLWENQQQQVCVYDKLRKMEHDKLPVAGLPRNSIRFEHRMLKSKKVRDALNFRSVADLLESYDSIASTYQQTMKKQLFRYEPAEVETIMASEIEADMTFFKGKYGRNSLSLYLKCYGLHSLLQLTNMETILGAVENVFDDRKKKSRMKAELLKMRFDTQAMRVMGPSKRTTGQLYAELREKVLGQ